MATSGNRPIIAIVIIALSHASAACATVPGPSPLMDSPCGGQRVPIETVLARRACERDCDGKRAPAGIQGRLQLGTARVAGGGSVQVRAILRNTTKTPAVLPFIWHAGPMHVITVLDARGRPLGVEGTQPPFPPEGYRPGPPYPVCLRLAPHGEAHVERTWRAVRWRYAARPRLPSGEPVTEPAGPLPPGRYQLRLSTMYQDATAGAPTAWIEVR